MLADPFIPPTLIFNVEKKNKLPFLSESLNYLSLHNINQVKLFASRLTMQTNYQTIIDLISKIDFSQLEKDDYLDLNYWLSNAFLHTGKYKKAEDVIIANMEFALESRFHFLLAMTYEAQDERIKAQQEYLKFIDRFPQSEYKVSAQIKTRILGRR